MRIIAIDWSGAANNAAEKIWLAEAEGGQVIELWNGRTREEVCDYLIAAARRDTEMAIGLDFAFSLPAWYVRDCGFRSAPVLWSAVAAGRGESWLRDCPPPFFGRKGKRATPQEQFRRTETESRSPGISPQSVFKINGAGAVGTGSLRGMPVLQRLHEAGFSVWPFCDPGMPVVIEIYPRLLIGPVIKSDAGARRTYLDQHYPHITGTTRTLAASSADAFDAAVSALVMWDHRAELASLTPASDDTTLLEGQIWRPAADICEH